MACITIISSSWQTHNTAAYQHQNKNILPHQPPGLAAANILAALHARIVRVAEILAEMSWFRGKQDKQEASFGAEDVHHEAPVMQTGGGSLADLQEFSLGVQEQVVIQQVITDMADKAFVKCIAAFKDPKLSGREVACIAAVSNKWLDTNSFLEGRMARKMQQQAQQQQGMY
jgi:Tim10/DDP family zinc finger